MLRQTFRDFDDSQLGQPAHEKPSWKSRIQSEQARTSCLSAMSSAVLFRVVVLYWY